MKKKLIISLFILTIISSLIFVGCTKEDSNGNLFTVTFDYGYDEIIETKSYHIGELVQLPSVPTREGYRFVKWECEGKEFDPNTRLINDSTIKIIWQKTKDINVIVGENTTVVTVDDKNTYTIDEFVIPNLDGYLCGFYTIENNEYKYFDVSDGFTEDITVYADYATFGIELENNGHESSIKRFKGTSNNIVLPNFYKGAKVTKIANDAFYEANIESIVYPKYLQEIGAGAFSNVTCTNFIVPKTVEQIGVGAFTSINAKSFTFEEGSLLKNIGENAFYWAEGFDTIILPDMLTELKSSTFVTCVDLKTVYIPKSVKKLENYIFMGCLSLEKIYLENDLVKPQKGMFWNYIYEGSEPVMVELIDEIPNLK